MTTERGETEQVMQEETFAGILHLAKQQDEAHCGDESYSLKCIDAAELILTLLKFPEDNDEEFSSEDGPFSRDFWHNQALKCGGSLKTCRAVVRGWMHDATIKGWTRNCFWSEGDSWPEVLVEGTRGSDHPVHLHFFDGLTGRQVIRLRDMLDGVVKKVLEV